MSKLYPFWQKCLKRALWLVLFFSFLNPLQAQKWLDMMNDETVNFYDVQREADRYFQEHGTGRGTGYKQYKRWEYETQFQIDQQGNRRKSIEILEEFNRYKTERTKGNELRSEVGGDNWVNLGPTYWNRTSGWNPGVGRITSIAVDPKNNNIIYITSPGGGIWKTSNGGTSWTPLSDNLSRMVMFSAAVDPVNSNVVYFGSQGIGLYKSTNGGSTLTAINSGYPTSSTANKILIHPTNSNIVMVASSAGIYRSTNGGSSWTQVRSGGFNDLEFKPGDPNTVYASGTTFFKSTDGGVSFNQITSGLTTSGRSFISVTPANPNYVYMVQARGSEFGVLYRSTNSGTSFTARVTGSAASGTNYFGYSPNGTDTGGQAGYDMAMCVSNTNAEEVHIAGIICWKSTNGGSSFVSTTEWIYPNNRGYNHADVHALEYVGNTIYSGSDGGIFKSTNGADDWTDLSKGLSIRQFYRIACAATDASMVGGGSQDNGHSILRSGNWIDWLGADGMDVMIDHKNANIVYACTQNGGLNKSTNGGQSRTSISSPPGSGNWVTPLAMDPVTPSTIYIGYAELYRSTNSGSSWTQISSFGGGGLNNVVVAPSNGNYIYASKGSTLYVTKNGGTSWTNITSGLSGTITSITVHNSSPEKVAVSTSNGTAKVYKSTNAGASWTNFQKSLPNLAAHTVVFQNGNAEGMYVGMDVGVYYIDNSMNAWVPFMTNLPNVKINELEIHHPSNKIRVATYGRGLWESPLYNAGSTNQPPSVSLTAPANNATYTAPASITITATASDPDGSVTKVDFYNGNLLLGTATASPYTFNWTNVAAGTYTITARATDNAGANTTSAGRTVVVNEPVACTPPTNLTVSNLTATSATLSWTATPTAQSYVVWHRKSTDPWTLNQTVTGTSVTLTGLSPSTAYQWTLLANCPSGNSGFTSPYPTFTTPAAVNQAPVISLTAPANNATYTAPANITISANASDPDGSISKVDFFNGTTLLSTVTASPYTFNWTNVAAGTYSITARATDNGGATTTTNAVTVVVNAVATCDAPAGLTASNITTTSATLSWSPVAAAQSYLVWHRKSTDAWTLNQTVTGTSVTLTGLDPNTAYQWTIRSNCASGNSGYSSPYPTFTTSALANQPPVVSLTSPTNNATYTAPASITISANASDPDGTIAKVEFFNGTTKITESTTSPYGFVWSNVGAGTYTFTARATDNAGATATSTVITVTVNNPVNQPPTVSLTAPANNSTYTAPASVTITASASDADGSITRVEFFSGATKLGERTTTPYSYTWTNVAAGTYSITARATDNSGAVTTSAARTITVNPATDLCASLPQYVENNGYAAGSRVKNVNNRYECKPWPYSGWCNGAAWAYAPGTGTYWTDAWTSLGSCSSGARSADNQSNAGQAGITSMPNPFTSVTNIDVAVVEAGEVSVQVFDKTGVLVQTIVQGYLPTGTYTYLFDATNLQSGMYLIKYNTNSGVIVDKVVKTE